MSTRSIETKSLQWKHISRVQEKDLKQLQEEFRFHHLDYDDIRAETPISKMDPYKHYIFFVFHIPVLHKDTQHVVGEELYVFISEDTIVTATHVALPSIDALFDKLKSGTKARTSMMSKGAAFLLYRILTEAFRDSLSIVGELTREVQRLEDSIEHKHDKILTVDLGHTRRNVLFLRHVIDPQRSMLTSLSNLKRSFLSTESHLYFDDLHDSLDTVWLSADNLKLIIDGLFDVNEALLSHKTNDIVTLLTIISAALMVPTLISGFYGMNVSWLPYKESPEVVAMFFLVGFLAMILLVVYITRRPRS